MSSIVENILVLDINVVRLSEFFLELFFGCFWQYLYGKNVDKGKFI